MTLQRLITMLQHARRMTFKEICQKTCTKVVEKLFFMMGKKWWPLKNCILIENSSNFDGHAWEIYLYYKKTKWLNKWKFIWLIEDYPFIPDMVRNDPNTLVYNRSALPYQFYYYLSRAKVLLFENFTYEPASKRQLTIYLNHGFPIKNTIGAIRIPDYVKYSCSPTKQFADILAKQFSIPTSSLIYIGSPRVDAFYRDSNELVKLGIDRSQYDNVIIWMPTFRRLKDYPGRIDGAPVSETGIALINTCQEFAELEDLCTKNNLLLLVKLHPRQFLEDIHIASTGNVRIVDEVEMQRNHVRVYSLLKETDALISDYSSVSLDYMLLDKPIAYTVNDLAQYTRGVSTDDPFFFMAGDKLCTFNDLIEFITKTCKGADDYAVQRQSLCNKFWDYQDGNSTDRLMSFVKSRI